MLIMIRYIYETKLSSQPTVCVSILALFSGRIRSLIFTISFFSILRKVHSLFQSHFSIECDIVLPLSISNILSFPKTIKQLLNSSSSSSCHFHSSLYPSYDTVFYKAVTTQDMTNPVSFPTVYSL